MHDPPKRNRSPGGGCGGSRNAYEAGQLRRGPFHKPPPVSSAANILTFPERRDGVYLGFGSRNLKRFVQNLETRGFTQQRTRTARGFVGLRILFRSQTGETP
jgi:hypothetical protein